MKLKLFKQRMLPVLQPTQVWRKWFIRTGRPLVKPLFTTSITKRNGTQTAWRLPLLNVIPQPLRKPILLLTHLPSLLKKKHVKHQLPQKHAQTQKIGPLCKLNSSKMMLLERLNFQSVEVPKKKPKKLKMRLKKILRIFKNMKLKLKMLSPTPKRQWLLLNAPPKLIKMTLTAKL